MWLLGLNSIKRLIYKRKILQLFQSPSGLRLNLGCGDTHFEKWLNCDCRSTKTADLIIDCSNLSIFKDNTVSLIFSHAFFEHLYKKQQLACLKDCSRVLMEKGALIFLGIPDFKVIAESYLSKAPGHQGMQHEIFDLWHVYRYTHGDPEANAPNSWLEFLHKSLFDREYIRNLFLQLDFKCYAIFNYCHKDENIPLCLGFVMWKSRPEDQMKELKNLLHLLPQKIIKDIDEPLRTLEINNLV